jgi:parallel beta-helix repeat protein
MRRYGKTTIAIALTVLLYLGFIIPMLSLSSTSPEAEERGKTLSIPVTSPSEQLKTRLVNVTLITGDIVFAMVAENGTVLSVSIHPADPTKLGQNFLVLKMRNFTYVIPSSVNLSKFDLELFNIDLLIKEGYSELPYIPVIISSSGVVGALIERFQSSEGKVTHVYSIIPAFAAKIPTGKAKEISELLTSSQDVRKVWLDKKVYAMLSESAPLIGAPDAWAIGLNGTGVRIAILDTGIDSRHEDFFFPNGSSKVEKEVSFVPDEPPYDYHGHGTHVASIAAGTGKKSITTSSIFRGVAYGATLWNVKVLNRWGWGYESWVIAGVEYAALGPDMTPNTGDEADVLSLSLGAYRPSDGTDPLSRACDKAVELGRVVVVAAGNIGWRGYFTISVPGVARNVITVGASDKSDVLAWFSSRGPTVDYRVKPDIVAPGVGIWAALARGSLIEYWANQGWIPALDVDGDGWYDYVRLSGTSMSTPHISGVVALLKQLNPHLKPEEIKNVLISTAKDLGYDVYQQCGGRVNVTSAINTPIIVNPAIISLGVITEDTLIDIPITFTFKPLLRQYSPPNVTLSLEVFARDITGRAVSVSLNTTTITIPLNGSKAVLLTVDTNVRKAIYEGKVIARVVGGPWDGRTVHIIFGFSRLNEVVIRMINREGSPAAYKPVLVFGHEAPYEPYQTFWFTYTDSNGTARIYLRDGEYYIIGKDVDYSVSTDIWMIVERIPINRNTMVTLDERNAREVNFDPAKPKQVFAAKSINIIYRGETFGLQWGSLWWYPLTALTYITNTTLGVSFSYEYYNRDYFNVASPSVIDAPEWHNLIYWQEGITPPVTYVANYSNLVKRVTEYRTPGTPRISALLSQHKWSPLEWRSSEFMWIMNIPRARVEWLTPDINYWTIYLKFRDPPWVSTPYWLYAYWPFLKERYSVGEVNEVFGGHPLSTQLLVFVGSSWLTMVSDLNMDTYGHTLWTDWGRIRVYRDGSLIADWSGFYYWNYFIWNDPRPARYKVEIEGVSNLWLSSYTHATFEFTVVSETTYHLPPNIYVNVRCLDLNNTCPAGEVIVDVFVNDPRVSSEANVTVKFSLDDGVSWLGTTPLSRRPGEPYSFRLGVLNNTYVSLWINATDSAGSSVSQLTIRGFYVKPHVIITVGPPGSGADYTSIREAVQVAPPHAEIRVLPGTYAEGVIVIDKPLTIRADSSDVTVTGHIPFYITNTKVTLKGLSITGGIGILALNSNVEVSGSRIMGGEVGLLAIDSVIAVEKTNILHNNRDGLALYGSSKVAISNSSLAHNRGAGIISAQSSYVSVLYSEIYNNTWGIILFDDSNLNVTKTIIHSNTFEGIAVLSRGDIKVRLTEIRDNYHGLNLRGYSNSLISESQVTSNREAGIVVADEANVLISNSRVRDNRHGIVSYDNARVKVYNSVFVGGNEGVLATRYSRISLVNSSITGNNIAGILAIEYSKVELIKSTVHNSSWVGIAAYGKSTVDVVDSLVSNATWEAIIAWEKANVTIVNTILTSSGRGATAGMNSSLSMFSVEIREVRLEGVLAVGNTRIISNNTLIMRSGISGISAYDSGKLLLTNVTISMSGWANIALFHNSLATIKHSNLTLSGANGVILYDNASVSIYSSEVSSNVWGIMVFGNSHITLNKVRLFNNSWDGLVLWDNSKAYVTASTITFNKFGASVYHNANLTIHYSSITNNTGFGIRSDSTIPVNATHNWWGDPSGPYHPTLNPTGKGDRVSDSVLFNPWLTSPPEQSSLDSRSLKNVNALNSSILTFHHSRKFVCIVCD